MLVQHLNFFNKFGSIFEHQIISFHFESLVDESMTMAEPVSSIQDPKDIVIDDIDRQILNLLIANARNSARIIAKKLSDIGINMSERE